MDSKTVGRYCNRCAPVDTEVKVSSCSSYSERNQSNQRTIRKCTERYSEVLGIRSVDPRFVVGNSGSQGMENFYRDTSSTHTVERSKKSMCG